MKLISQIGIHNLVIFCFIRAYAFINKQPFGPWAADTVGGGGGWMTVEEDQPTVEVHAEKCVCGLLSLERWEGSSHRLDSCK